MFKEYEFIVTIAVQLLAAAFVYGRLTERVRGHGKRIEKVEGDQAASQKDITRHEGEIGELFGHAGISRH